MTGHTNGKYITCDKLIIKYIYYITYNIYAKGTENIDTFYMDWLV